MRGLFTRVRPGLAVAGVVLIAGMLLPPAGGYARHYAAAQALQFVVFAAAAPALLVIGAPERWRRRADRLAGRLPDAGWPAVRRAMVRLLAFMVVVVAWRLPGAVAALASSPVLALAEMATLVSAGTLVWIELTAQLSSPSSLIRPQRAAVAAFSMWTIWAIAYVTGMFTGSLLAPFAHAAATGLSAGNDRQLAAAVMWAIPAFCFVPVVFAMILTWLRDSEDPDQELRSASLAYAGNGDLPRPPRGWRTPAA